MISIDQVLLLQQKVESAVQKIVELKSENDALRRQCSELTNALSEKSELLASFSANEKKIEDSILGALDRLNRIENSVISSAGQNTASKSEAAPLSSTQSVVDSNQVSENTNNLQSAPESPVIEEPQVLEDTSSDVIAPEFDLDVSENSSSEQDTIEKEEKFDIF